MEDAAATSSTSTARARVAANLRAGPGTTYALIGGAAAGQRLEIVATNEDRSWYQLASGAWIAAFLVENALVVPALRAAGLIQ